MLHDDGVVNIYTYDDDNIYDIFNETKNISKNI